MTPEENKAIMLRFFDEIVKPRRYDLAHKYVTSDFKRFDLCKLFPDRAGSNAVNDHMSVWLTGVPDLQIDPVDVFAGEDRVCVRYEAYGTHTGELLGRPGTGKPVRFQGINVYRMVDGRIQETWQYLDGLNLLRQIGDPPPEHS
jgi:steroid delta-isomerase-like uncharacterized protein